MFELDKHKAKLTSVNPRAELHGEDKKPAIDLHIEAACSNDVLTGFDGFLKGALYKKDDGAQGDMIDDPGYLPVLKFPDLGPLKWDYTGAGYALRIHYGIDGKSDIEITECQIDKFKFVCQPGGTVIVSFRVICHTTEENSGRLCAMVGQSVELTVTPPAPEQDSQQQAAA